MALLYIGVDGGTSGALAFYRPANRDLRVYSIPSHVRKTRGKERSYVDPDTLNAILAMELGLAPDAKAFLEVGVGDSRQSSAASYNYGFTNGAVWLAVRSKLAHEHVQIVHPSVWKRHFGLVGKDKEASRRKALRFWPEHTALARKGDHNKAEAALIALYGCERNG